MDDSVSEWQCGCKTWREENIFFIEPCGKPDCLVLPIVLEESKKQGNEIRIQNKRG